MPLDVVYYVRPGERNDELRYSLRSLANLPHGRVWIVGHKPSWVTGVEYLEGNRGSGPQQRAVNNLRLACETLEVDRFVVFNDDFYVMRPVPGVPPLHAGTLDDRIAAAATGYRQQLRAAADLLASLDIRHALAWTLHIPVLVYREVLLRALDLIGTRRPVPEWRTVYGALSRQPGYPADDVKVRRRSDPIPTGPFLSSQDGSFDYVRDALRRLFPEPCEYEA